MYNRRQLAGALDGVSENAVTLPAKLDNFQHVTSFRQYRLNLAVQ
jgi:hypothetical protein